MSNSESLSRRGFLAGGSTDIVARLVGQKLGELLDQSIVIDNRAGAGGNIGSMGAGRQGFRRRGRVVARALN